MVNKLSKNNVFNFMNKDKLNNKQNDNFSWNNNNW